MGYSVFPEPTVATDDNWVQIATATPTSGSSVSFTSIPTNYKKLWLVSNGITLSTTATIAITINSITAANSYRCARGGASTTVYIGVVDLDGISASSATFSMHSIILENPGFGLPFVVFNGYQSTTANAGNDYRMGNVITATTPITQIDLTLSAGDLTTNTGTLYLYGTE